MRLFATVVLCALSTLWIPSCNKSDEAKLMPVTTDSDQALEYYREGMVAFDQVKFSEAMDQLKMAVELDPDFFMAYFWMYLMSGKGAKKIADAAMQSDAPLNAGEKHIKTAFKYLVSGQYEKVVENLKAAIQLYPEDPDVHKILYIIQFQIMWDLEGAVETLENAIGAIPDYPLAYNQLGYALMELDEFKKAEEAFDTYIRLAPDVANPYDSKGDFYMNTGQYEAAYESYMKAFETDSTFTVSEKKARKARELMEN